MWASPIGDLHLVCMSDGIVNIFSCKKKNIMCFDVVTEIKDIMHCKQQKNRCLEIIGFNHQLLLYTYKILSEHISFYCNDARLVLLRRFTWWSSSL